MMEVKLKKNELWGLATKEPRTEEEDNRYNVLYEDWWAQKRNIEPSFIQVKNPKTLKYNLIALPDGVIVDTFKLKMDGVRCICLDKVEQSTKDRLEAEEKQVKAPKERVK